MADLAERADVIAAKIQELAEQRDTWRNAARLMAERLGEAVTQNEELQRELALATAKIEELRDA